MNEEGYEIGTIDFSDCYDDEEPEFELNVNLNEVQVGPKANLGQRLGECTIHVFGSEGGIPHCHIRSKSDKIKSDICIRLSENAGFPHGIHKGYLDNKKEMKKFNDFMEAKNNKNPSITNWEACVIQWNKDAKFPLNQTKQPDYSTIERGI